MKCYMSADTLYILKDISWIDMRRYNRLNQLPLDRPDDNVWSEFPLPVTEQ